MTTYLPGVEGITVSRWIVQHLADDPALQALAGTRQALAERIAEGTYPGTAPWWIVFTILEPQDVKGVGMIQIMSRVQFQVKVVTKGASYAPIIPIYQRVHALLEAQQDQEPAPGGVILTCERVSGVQYTERADGIEYRTLGGLYEALTQ